MRGSLLPISLLGTAYLYFHNIEPSNTLKFTEYTHRSNYHLLPTQISQAKEAGEDPSWYQHTSLCGAEGAKGIGQSDGHSD